MNRFAALLAIVSCTASVAYAHNTQLSSAKLQIAGTLVMADIDMNGRDLEVALGRRLLGADGAVRPAALAEAAGAVAGYLTERLILGTRDVHCRLRVASLEPVAEHVRVRAEFPCPRFSGALVYRATLFTEVDPRARHMVTVTGDTKRFALLSVTTPTLEITSVRESPWVVCGRYLLAGIEHIAIGFDHVAFLLVTIVWARRSRRVYSSALGRHKTTMRATTSAFTRLCSPNTSLGFLPVADHTSSARETRIKSF